MQGRGVRRDGVAGYRRREDCEGVWKEGVTRHLRLSLLFLRPGRVKRLTEC